MARIKCLIVSIFLVSIFAALGVLFDQRVIELNKVWEDVLVLGEYYQDWSGCAVAFGNINIEGYDDIIDGAPHFGASGGDHSGEIYMTSGADFIITAHGFRGSSVIKQFDNYGNPIRRFIAFGPVANPWGEIHLAVGDIDGDGLHEIAAGHGEGGNSIVKLFEMDGTLIHRFKAFGPPNTQGEVHLAIGNFDVNLSDKEIAVAQGEGGQSLVKVFRADGSELRRFRAFGAPNAQGEVHLAAADLENSDGIDEIIAGMGEEGSSMVNILTNLGTLIGRFQAFSAFDNPGGEVHVTVGNFNSDTDIEIAVATGYNGGNLVKLFEKNGTLISKFRAFGPPNAQGEVHLAAADLNNDGIDEIIAGMGEGGSSLVKIFNPWGKLIRKFTAFGLAVNPGGEVHLAVKNLDSDTFLIGDSPACDFSTIKEAVESDLVNYSDTLEVLPGTYYENYIIINKNITITGQAGEVDSTIIDGDGSEEIFNIQAHGVTIKGLAMKNCNSAIIIDSYNNCQIVGNKFMEIDKPIILESSDQNQIKDNTFDNPTRAIHLHECSNNIFTSNKFYNAHREGIRLSASSCNTISNNYFESSDHEAILLASSSNNNTVINNTINDQSQGIDSNLGISLSSSSYNVVKNNIIKNCNHNIFIHQNKNQEMGGGEIATGNIIEGNTAENGMDGILLREANNNEIINNIISHNDRGLVAFSSSTGNSIIGNTVTYNNQEGILIHSDSPGNTISDNIEYSNNLGNYSFSVPSIFNLYWGDIHGHSNKSDGRGSVDEYYKYARDIVKLDISAVSDHGTHLTGHIMTQTDWKLIRDTAKYYYQPNEFVTFSGYEWTAENNPYCHHNIYYLTDDDELPLIPAKENPNFYYTEDIYALLDLIRASGKDFIMIPHHGLGDGRYQIPNPSERVAAEICSIHGRSEFYHNQPIRTWFLNGYGNTQDVLKTGARLGVISNSDTHRSLPGEWGIFGVYAENLTRESIFDSIKKRRTYGTTGARIGLWFDINGYIMGEEFSLFENPTIYVKVKGEKNIDKIEIIKHIENSSMYPFPTVHSEYPGQREFEFYWIDTNFTENSLYYIRVTQEDGEMAWSSPIWVNKE